MRARMRAALADPKTFEPDPFFNFRAGSAIAFGGEATVRALGTSKPATRVAGTYSSGPARGRLSSGRGDGECG
jgi:hypothetical protein